MGAEDSQKSVPRRQIARLIGSSLLPVAVLSEDDVVVFVNEALEKLLAIDADRLIGLDCSFRARADVSKDNAIDAASIRLAPSTTWNKLQIVVESDTEPDGLRLFIPLDASMADPSSANTGQVLVLLVPESKPHFFSRHSETSSLVDPLLHRWFRSETDENWYLAGTSLKTILLRSQFEIARHATGSVAVIGNAPRHRNELAIAIHRSRFGAKTKYQPNSMVTIDCHLMDSPLLDSMFEVIEEVEKSYGSKSALLLSGLDLLPKDLITALDRFLAEHTKLSLFATVAKEPNVDSDASLSRLWLRVSAIKVSIPSIRERLEDLDALMVAWFQDWHQKRSAELRDTSKRQPTQMPMTAAFKDAIFAFPWYGDLDELATTLEHAIRQADGKDLDFVHLPSSVRTAASYVERSPELEPIDLDATLESIERKLTLEAIERCKGNRSAAAKLLNVSRARLMRRLQQWGIAAAVPDSSDSEESDSPMFEEIE